MKMQNNINLQKENLNMKRFMKTFTLISTMFWIMTLMLVGNAVDQAETITYHFEENGGTVAIDDSGNDNHGVISGAIWTTGASAFGTYGLSFDGNNDWVDTAYSQIPENFSISYWFSQDVTAKKMHWTLYGASDLMEITVDVDGGSHYQLKYVNDVSSNTNLQLDSTNFNQLQKYHIVVAFDNSNNVIHYYRDGVKTSHNLTSPIKRTDLTTSMRIGARQDGGEDFSGTLDEFREYNFVLNDSQVIDLNLNNAPTIDNGTNGEPEVNVTIADTIITSSSPAHSSNISNPVNFNLLLNTPASCDLYIDNQLEYSFNNLIAEVYSIFEMTPNQEYSYFWYCEYVENMTAYYELSNTSTFFVNEGSPQQVTFQITGNDFNTNDESLYITSPCMATGVYSKGLVLPYQSQYNTGGVHFAQLINGIATFNLSAEAHEFCLFNGRVIYGDTDQRVFNYDIVEAFGMLDLGIIEIPNNVSGIYAIKVDKFEIYDKTDPKAWNQTWVSIVPLLLMAFLGLVLLFAGIFSGSKGATLMGGLLLLSSFGIEMGGLFLGAIF